MIYVNNSGSDWEQVLRQLDVLVARLEQQIKAANSSLSNLHAQRDRLQAKGLVFFRKRRLGRVDQQIQDNTVRLQEAQSRLRGVKRKIMFNKTKQMTGRFLKIYTLNKCQVWKQRIQTVNDILDGKVPTVETAAVLALDALPDISFLCNAISEIDDLLSGS